MATTFTSTSNNNATMGFHVQHVVWTLTGTEKGDPIDLSGYSDKTVHIFGDFGGTGSVSMEGSNDPRVLTDPDNAVWTVLADPQGSAITKTAAAIETILENPRHIRPNKTITGGTLVIAVCARS